jgi:dihydroxyacetone kinase-like protein
MGVGLTSCVNPRVGKATFSISHDEIELGLGIHGEVSENAMKQKRRKGVLKKNNKQLFPFCLVVNRLD